MNYFDPPSSRVPNQIAGLPATEFLILFAFILLAILISAVVVGLAFGDRWMEWSTWISLTLGPPGSRG
jgi:hypothetical protein